MEHKFSASLYAPVLEEYAALTENLSVIVVDGDFRVTDYNAGFSKLIPEGADPTGKSLYSFLLPESHAVLSSVSGRESTRIRLVFGMPGGTPSPIECHVFKKAHGFVILGERLILTGDEALRRISLVNNEMANLLRDVQRKNRALDESEERYRTAIEHSNDGVALVRGDRHVYVNRRFLDMFGYDTPEGIIGEVTYVTVHPDDRERVMEYNRLRQQGLPAPSQYEFRGIRKDGTSFFVEGSVAATVYRGEACSLAYLRDITDRKHAEETIRKLLDEKELLIHEAHHRIKNNMNVIMSVLSLQVMTLHDPSAVAALNDSINRVRTMMVLYDKLYRTSDFRVMSAQVYLPPLVREIVHGFPVGEPIAVETDVEDIILDAKILSPLGMILNELISNSMKYAFAGRDSGRISVTLSTKDGHLALVMEDDGVGIPEAVDIETATGFGLHLVAMLTEQLDGTIRIERDRGSRFVLEFDL